jgi:hypothetical protein
MAKSMKVVATMVRMFPRWKFGVVQSLKLRGGDGVTG